MTYTITEVTEGEFKGMWALREDDMLLDRYLKEEQAEHGKKQWEARDALGAKIHDFVEQAISTYGNLLPGDEIHKMIVHGATNGH